MRFVPTRVIRRSLVGASQDRWMFATQPEGNRRSTNATSAGPTPQLERPVADTRTGLSWSHEIRIERSWGARSQITLTSDRWMPRLTRDDCTYRGSPISPCSIIERTISTGGLYRKVWPAMTNNPLVRASSTRALASTVEVANGF